jgi:hypothetical protein
MKKYVDNLDSCFRRNDIQEYFVATKLEKNRIPKENKHLNP